MENAIKFILPSPKFDNIKTNHTASKPQYITHSGMSLSRRTSLAAPTFASRGNTIRGKCISSQPMINQQKSDKQANDTQFCESCEMELQSIDDLRRHRRQHQRCQFDGCNYRGHQSVMGKHVETFHTTGLFDKLKKLSTSEEITAWREERRKRYPTVANVIMRQKAQEQRQKRGERLEQKKNRFANGEDRVKMQCGSIIDHNTKNGESNNRGQQNLNFKNIQRNNRRKSRKARTFQAVAKIKKTSIQANPAILRVDDIPVHICGLHMFHGTKHLNDYKHLKPKKSTTETNSLSALVALYGSDDDIDTESYQDQGILHAEDVHVEIISEHNFEICSNEAQQSRKNLSRKGFHCEPVEKDSINTFDLVEQSVKLIKNGEFNNINREESIENDLIPDESPEEVAASKFPHVPDVLPRNEPPRKRIKSDAPKLSRQRLHSTQSDLKYRNARLRKQNTLLEKLLEPDIRHEQNVLLQCVRFVCENNFFSG